MRGPFHPKSRPSPGLLVLSGLDGSGKSTQASLLTRRLLNAGYQVKTVWNRWEPMISAPLIRIAKRHLKTNEKVTADNYTDFTEAKQRRMKSPWKRSLWQFMVWSEYGLQVNLRLLPYFIRRTGLICDRYVYDTMIDIAINFSLSPKNLPDLFNHPLLVFYPKPAQVIFIDIDPGTGASRKNDGTPPTYLADRREYYIKMARILNNPVVDGRESIDEVSERIWELTSNWRKNLPRTGSCPDTTNTGNTE